MGATPPGTMPDPRRPMPGIFTIGHSNASSGAFVALLQRHAIGLLVDVRAAPYSRRHPQFRRETLAAALDLAGIRYRWLGAALGGLRAPRGASVHTALTEPAHQAYAAHMADVDFLDAVDKLVDVGARHRVALMCAEADHRHCHRQFIADALTARGVIVTHIGHGDSLEPHVTHPCLRIEGGALIYDRHGQAGLF